MNKFVHYEGNLGTFDYDPDLFLEVFNRISNTSAALIYIGDECDGNNIKIPDGIIDCTLMFYRHSSLVSPPVIPDSVKICERMFADCTSLATPPVIPEGVQNCDWMFVGCTALKEAVLYDVVYIPKSVLYCKGMYKDCSNIEYPPNLYEGLESCDEMFSGCTSLELAPIIPKSVTSCDDMFEGCSEYVQIRGDWNIEHREESYDCDYPLTYYPLGPDEGEIY